MKSYYLFLLLAICLSCNRAKQVNEGKIFDSKLTVVDSYVYYPINDNRIQVDIDNPEKASLFDYFSHIELIPLETNNDVLLGYCEEVNYYQGRYYIFDRKPHKVQIFDENGKFILQIDKRGQGPGEYIDLTSMIFNNFTGNIDVTGMGNIYSYDLTGKHVKTVNPKNSEKYFWNFIAINENMYVCYLLVHGKTYPYKINYYDLSKNKIIHNEYEFDMLFDNYVFITSISHTVFYEYNKKWFFYHMADNVTYEVGVDSLTRAYTWDFGKYNYDPKNLNLPDDVSSISALSYRISLQGQNNRYVLAQIGLRNRTSGSYVYLIHDKSINECKYIEQFTESVNFNPRKVTNEYVLTWCEHGALENYITEEMLDEENRKKFQKLLDAEEEQNPILIKYYFK